MNVDIGIMTSHWAAEDRAEVRWKPSLFKVKSSRYFTEGQSLDGWGAILNLSSGTASVECLGCVSGLSEASPYRKQFDTTLKGVVTFIVQKGSWFLRTTFCNFTWQCQDCSWFEFFPKIHFPDAACLFLQLSTMFHVRIANIIHSFIPVNKHLLNIYVQSTGPGVECLKLCPGGVCI